MREKAKKLKTREHERALSMRESQARERAKHEGERTELEGGRGWANHERES